MNNLREAGDGQGDTGSGRTGVRAIVPRSALRAPRFLWAALAGLFIAGCATEGPVAPLVPLPDSEMPSQADLHFRAWRLIVVEAGGPYIDLERVMTGELRQQVGRYGIQTVATDTRSTQVLENMLRQQAASGGEINVADLKFATASADGIVSAGVDLMTVARNNEMSSWQDKNKKTHYVYTSEVTVSGHCTIVLPKTGDSSTVQFSNSQTQTSYDKPHQLSPQHLAMEAVRQAARGGQVMSPIYRRFPLTGYVIGAAERYYDIRINRGSNHGVRRDRKWELLMTSREDNPLVGRLVGEQVVGSARTVEVYEDSCVARCDSKRTRERAKLGMKVRSGDFGFSLAGLFGLQ
jgi:hypothetical protein